MDSEEANTTANEVDTDSSVGEEGMLNATPTHVARQGFTSENFKIEINGLPKFFSVGQAKKLLVKKLGLKPHKFKPVGQNARYMFVNFSNEEERVKAIDKLNGCQIKGSKLRAFAAGAAKDPLLKQRGLTKSGDSAKPQEEMDCRSVDEKIRDAVCALANLPYEEQIETKLKDVEGVAKNLRMEYLKMLPLLKEENLAKVEPFVLSPVIDGYRNKCEFTVGRHPDTNEVTVGFRLASYKKGSVAVVGVDGLPIVSCEMKKVVKHFEDFVKSSGYEPYQHVSQQGYWRQLTVRSSRNGNHMVWAVLHPQNLERSERDEIATKLKDHFVEEETTGAKLQVSVTSLHIQFLGQKAKGHPDPPVEHLSGSNSIYETLMSGKLSFEISPRSFFQINADAAEKLYQTCADLACLDAERSILYDVCCGTGTIGLCLAEMCKRVVGIDVVEEAVANARRNAKNNGIDNAEFHAGRAEFLLSDLLKKHEDSSSAVVAIVDPPRAGLHPKAVTSLRATANIKTLIYVSCDAKAAMQSLVGLGRPPSNAFKGDPFVPVKIVPVDLFPHTKHFELVILFERLHLAEMLREEGN